MKKIFVFTCLLALVYPALGQMYIRANVGYNLPLSSELLGEEEHYENSPNTGTTATVKGVYGSYGSGFATSIAFGGAFKGSMLGYDIAFGYAIGKKYSANSTTVSPGYSSSEEITRYTRSFQFNPSISFIMDTGKKIQPFTRFGPVIAMSKLIEEETTTNTYEGNDYYMEAEYSGGLSIGLRAAVGVNYSLNDRLRLFTEINFLSMSYAPTQRSVETYTINGENRIDDIDPEYREVDLEKEYTIETEEFTPPLREPLSLSAWGLQVGVLFSLGQ
jgi:hypothetical protein